MYEIADESAPDTFISSVKAQLAASENDGQWITFSDNKNTHYRMAFICKGKLKAVLFLIGPIDFSFLNVLKHY